MLWMAEKIVISMLLLFDMFIVWKTMDHRLAWVDVAYGDTVKSLLLLSIFVIAVALWQH